MKIAATLLLLIILSAANAEKENVSEKCTNACPKIFDPVCTLADEAVGDKAAVYRYFHNECLRRYASCSTGKDFRITSLSLCLQHVDPLERAQCLRPCPFIYEPVCATNGKSKEIFGNRCILDIENCLSVEAWSLTEDNECGL